MALGKNLGLIKFVTTLGKLFFAISGLSDGHDGSPDRLAHILILAYGQIALA
jgi:hypothetical protein